jgi:hypothetical protein
MYIHTLMKNDSLTNYFHAYEIYDMEMTIIPVIAV